MGLRQRYCLTKSNLCAEYPQIATADPCKFPLVEKVWKLTSRNGILLYYSDFFSDKCTSAVCVKGTSDYETGESSEYDVETFFLFSWGCWDMNMPFWGKLIACSATKSKIPLFCELQFPKVHCSSKAVITM